MVSPYLASIAYPLSQSVEDLGVNFFFCNYTFYEPPFYSDHHTWLTHSYLQDRSNHVLRPAIEAIGMAGLANVSRTPYFRSMAEERHCIALAAIRHALNDSVQATEDTTLMAVILIELFEVLMVMQSRMTIALAYLCQDCQLRRLGQA